MRRVKGAVAIVLLLAILGLATITAAGGPPALPRWVVAGGGGRAASGDLLLNATVGQSLVGTNQARPLELCAGFWCAGLPGSHVYLPLAAK